MSRQIFIFTIFFIIIVQTAMAVDIVNIEMTDGYTLSIPSDWRIKNDQEMQQYMKIANKVSSQIKNVTTTASVSRVVFQALKDYQEGTASIMMTILPPESSQEEVDGWNDRQILLLGKYLGDVHTKVLTKAGCSEVSYSRSTKFNINDLLAVYFDLYFINPEHNKRVGEKYYIYTLTNTVILTIEYPEQLVNDKNFMETTQGFLDSFKKI